MSKRKVYRVSCAGCHEARTFASVADLGAWGASHRCWLGASA